MNLLCRSIAILSVASLFLGCEGGGGTSEPAPQTQDPGAAEAEAKKLMGGMTPAPIKQGPAAK